MSKTLILEIPDEVFTSVQQQAENTGTTTEKFALEIILKNLSKTGSDLPKQEKTAALNELMKFAGAVSSGDLRAADNERIDVDLAAEYGKDL